jgi:hypothetical protein
MNMVKCSHRHWYEPRLTSNFAYRTYLRVTEWKCRMEGRNEVLMSFGQLEAWQRSDRPTASTSLQYIPGKDSRAIHYHTPASFDLNALGSASTLAMSLLRSSRLISSARGQLRIVPRTATRSIQHRQISFTATRQSEHAHEDHYDQPGGWLFGVKPGEKPEKEGWENVWYYGFFGSMAFGVVGYWYKPDTR